MIRSLWTSATGMQAQELNIDVICKQSGQCDYIRF